MRRKIILHGPSTLSVSLPSNWVKQNNIKKGDEIEIAELGSDLIFKPLSEEIIIRSKEVAFSGLLKEVRRDILLSLYKDGYDEIKIIYDKPSIVKEITSYINSMHLGFEVIKQEDDFILLRNISNPSEDVFDNLFRRIFRLSLEYALKIHSIIEYQDTVTETCLLHEESIFRLSNFCERIISKSNKEKSQFLLIIIQQLKNIANIFTHLLNYMESIDYKHSVAFEPLLEESINQLEMIYKLYYSFSLSKYTAIKKQSAQLEKKILLYQQDNKDSPYYVECMHKMISALKQLSTPILSINL